MAQGNVLVVEDDDAIRRLLIEYLRERAGLHVYGVRDGVEALHQITTRPYRVIVLDLMMPYMSGIDFLDSLKAAMSDPSVKAPQELPSIIVITSAPHEEVPSHDLKQRFPIFVDSVMRKPLDAAALATRVEALLA